MIIMLHKFTGQVTRRAINGEMGKTTPVTLDVQHRTTDSIRRRTGGAAWRSV